MIDLKLDSWPCWEPNSSLQTAVTSPQMRRDFDLELQAARDERSDAIEREIAERERRAAAAARLLAPMPAPPVYPQPTPAVGYDEEYLDDLGTSPLAFSLFSL